MVEYSVKRALLDSICLVLINTKGVDSWLKARPNNRLKMGSFSLMLIVFLSILGACNDKEEDSQQVEPDQEAVNGSLAEEQSTDENPTSEEELSLGELTADLPQCAEVKLEKDTVIEGNSIAHCMMAAMLAVETGSHRVEGSDGTNSIVDFQFTPEFSMNVDNGNTVLIIEESNGWIKMENGKWYEEGDTSEDEDSILATNIIKLARAFSHPYMITQYLALSPEWTVVEKGQVPAEDAYTETAWKIISNAPIVMEGITITDIELWLTDEFLGAYYQTTSTVAGFTATGSNTYLQWGEPITIRKPNE